MKSVLKGKNYIKFILLSFLLIIIYPCYSQPLPILPRVEEEDGAPSVSATKIKMPNSSLTNHGDGSVSLNFNNAGGWIYDPNSAILSFININSLVGFGTSDPNAVIDIEIQSATTKGLRMQGSNNQTADYIQIVDSNSSEKFVVEADGDIQFRDKTIKKYSDDFGTEGSFSQTYNSNSDRNWMLGITDNDLYIYYYSGGGWVEHSKLERAGGIVGTSDINWRFDHEAGDYIIYYYNSDTAAWVEHSRFSKPSGVKSIYGLTNWSIRNETNLDFYYWNLNTLAWSAHSTFSKP